MLDVSGPTVETKINATRNQSVNRSAQNSRLPMERFSFAPGYLKRYPAKLACWFVFSPTTICYLGKLLLSLVFRRFIQAVVARSIENPSPLRWFGSRCLIAIQTWFPRFIVDWVSMMSGDPQIVSSLRWLNAINDAIWFHLRLFASCWFDYCEHSTHPCSGARSLQLNGI